VKLEKLGQKLQLPCRRMNVFMIVYVYMLEFVRVLLNKVQSFKIWKEFVNNLSSISYKLGKQCEP
jgi:hypothetical protein